MSNDTVTSFGTLDAQAVNANSHTKETAGVGVMADTAEDIAQISADQEAAARAAIIRELSGGNSLDRALEMADQVQGMSSGLAQRLLAEVAPSYPNAKQTQVEAEAAKAEEAQAITGALVGAPVMLATGVAAGGMLAGMFSGPKEEQYKQGAGALLADSGAAAQADSIGAFLMGSGNIMGANAISDGMSPSNVQMTRGIPAQQRSQQTGMGA